MLRSYGDVVYAVSAYHSLLARVAKLLAIYKRTRMIDIKPYKLVRVVSVVEEAIQVELLTIEEYQHNRQEPIYEWDLGGRGEQIGSETVYSHSTCGLEAVQRITIPASDVGVVDDELLSEVESRCIAAVAERNRLKRIADAEQAVLAATAELEKAKAIRERAGGGQ